MNEPAHSWHWLLLGGFTSLFFFVLQGVLISSFYYTTTYFIAYVVIAVSLVGFVLGGYAASVALQGKREHLFSYCLYALIVAPFVALLAVIISVQYVAIAVLLLTCVFFPVGFVLGFAYTKVNAWHLYGFELIGALLGLVSLIVLIPFLREENLLILASVVSAAFIVYWTLIHKKSVVHLMVIGVVTLALSALLYVNYTKETVHFAYDVICPTTAFSVNRGHSIFCSDEEGRSYTVVRSYGSLVNRIEIAAVYGMEDMLTTFFSGKGIDILRTYEPDTYTKDARVPTVLFQEPKTLIIGAGAEGVAKPVIATGATDITVVELNKSLVTMWEEDAELSAFARHPFASTTLVHAHGRTFVHETDELFDLITLMNTRRSGAENDFGNPDYVHTIDAFQAMFGRLTPTGILSIEEPNLKGLGTERIVSVVHTIRAALEDLDVSNPTEHMLVYQWVGAERGEEVLLDQPVVYTQILLRKEPWDSELVRMFEEWAYATQNTNQFENRTNVTFTRMLWPPSENHMYTDEPIVHALSGGVDRTKVLSDTKPFFQTVSSELKLFISIVLVMFSGVVYFFLRRRATTFGPICYFFTIGVGYMSAELLLLYVAQLHLGSVVLSIAVVFGGMFSGSALSSLYLWRNVNFTTCLLIALPIIVTLILLGSVTISLLKLDLLYRLLALSTTSFLVGVLLAPYFPHSVDVLKKRAAVNIPFLVAVNGLGLAFAIPLGILVGASFGLLALPVLMLIAYLAAVCIQYLS